MKVKAKEKKKKLSEHIFDWSCESPPKKQKNKKKITEESKFNELQFAAKILRAW